MIALLVVLIPMLVLLILLYVVPMLTYGIARLVSASVAAVTSRVAGKRAALGLWGEVATGGAVCAAVAALVYLLGSERPQGAPTLWAALITLPAFVRVVRQAFARHVPGGVLKFAATLVSLAVFAVAFATLRPALPLWQHVQYPNCPLDVRFDTSGRVNGIHGDATACFGVDFSSTAFATLDIVALEDDCIVARDLLLTSGREQILLVPPGGRPLYRRLILDPMHQRQYVVRRLGWAADDAGNTHHACR